MDQNLINEDAIDIETLQAQIDLSMSVAHDMISSWIKPSNKPANKGKKSIDEELKEHLRRPARLGVGATVPESYSSMTRETAQLKTRLTKGLGKRVREETEAGATPAPQVGGEDEDESRAGSIKKKPRIDPFSEKKKKKKKHKSAVDTQQAPDTQHTTLQPPASFTLPEIASTSVLPDIPNDESMKPLCSDTGLTSELETKSANFSTTSIDPTSIQAGPGIAGQPIPVLNLGEPNQENSSIQDATAGSAKKKRRRKKKKKTLQDAKSNDVLASN